MEDFLLPSAEAVMTPPAAAPTPLAALQMEDSLLPSAEAVMTSAAAPPTCSDARDHRRLLRGGSLLRLPCGCGSDCGSGAARARNCGAARARDCGAARARDCGAA